MAEIVHDIKAAVRAALDTWTRNRWLRKHGNPDQCPF